MADNSKTIETPTENDILSGRGNGINNYSGNVKYRKLVKETRIEYVTKTKKEKASYGEKIYNEIKNWSPAGRFLKKEKVSDRILWVEMDREKAIDKIRQALREGAPKVAKDLKRLKGIEDINEEMGKLNKKLNQFHKKKQDVEKIKKEREQVSVDTDVVMEDFAKLTLSCEEEDKPRKCDMSLSDLAPAAMEASGASLLSAENGQIIQGLLSSKSFNKSGNTLFSYNELKELVVIDSKEEGKRLSGPIVGRSVVIPHSSLKTNNAVKKPSLELGNVAHYNNASKSSDQMRLSSMDLSDLMSESIVESSNSLSGVASDLFKSTKSNVDNNEKSSDIVISTTSIKVPHHTSRMKTKRTTETTVARSSEVENNDNKGEKRSSFVISSRSVVVPRPFSSGTAMMAGPLIHSNVLLNKYAHNKNKVSTGGAKKRKSMDLTDLMSDSLSTDGDCSGTSTKMLCETSVYKAMMSEFSEFSELYENSSRSLMSDSLDMDDVDIQEVLKDCE